jgi:hypothetical protein
MQVLAPHIGFDADNVPQHSRHHVVPEDNDFLIEEFYSARVGGEVRVRDFLS